MDYLQVFLTALFSAVVLFILTKLMGHKQMAQLDVFDYVNGITIGSIVAELATELEDPVRPLIALLVYAAVALALSIISNKFPSSRKIVLGHPVLLLDNGKMFRSNFKKSKLDLNEFLYLCRSQGYFDISQIQTAVFEANGSVSILPKSANRPATPGDMKIYPAQEKPVTEVIMDGKIVSGSLEKLLKDEKWLLSQLKGQNIPSVKQTFFAFADDKCNLTAYPKD
ncbi:MAG: DUF421 domain-containing protein [Acutalibacteraceae bacterium]